MTYRHLHLEWKENNLIDWYFEDRLFFDSPNYWNYSKFYIEKYLYYILKSNEGNI